ncbi:DUF3421 domain-containing protein [Sporobolomyces salmoneus]|uniref:DUF3421 domain-containing protein n=1 Tax=Sporobolomyces salmoneus TaxID=183962 RepID=UPI003178F80A
MSMDSKTAPPPYAPSTPAAGLRVPCSSTNAFPSSDLVGKAPFRDLDGGEVFVASALLEGGNSVHPCKVTNGRCMISFAGSEHLHQGRFDILPITPEMEWVPASYGQIPKGRRPVEGGFEENGSHLFHAVISIDGCSVPGKTGSHLHGANFPWNGGELVEEGGYSVLCWKS